MSDERLKRAKPPPEPGPPYIAAASKSEISHSLSEKPRLLKLKFRLSSSFGSLYIFGKPVVICVIDKAHCRQKETFNLSCITVVLDVVSKYEPSVVKLIKA